MVKKEYIEELILKNTLQLNAYKCKLNENYLYHFEWVSERIFKLEWKNKTLADILLIFNDDNIVDKEGYINRMKDRFRSDLITRPLMTTSNNPLADLTSLWISECKQELIANLTRE